MIVGSGIDIAEVPRIRQSIGRFGDRFSNECSRRQRFDTATPKQTEWSAMLPDSLKEAAMKALGTGWNHGVRWRDCEVVRIPGGRPTMTFHGRAAEFAAKLGVKNTALSLSHTAEQAIAQVILES